MSEERITPIIRVTEIGEIGRMLAVTSNRSTLWRNTDDGGDMFCQNIGSYESHMASHPKLRAVNISLWQDHIPLET
jgi:hypothetical protein